MDIVIILLNLICRQISAQIVCTAFANSVPDSTPTTDVNSSASLLVTPLAPLPPSAFFLSDSFVPGMMRLPFTGAFEVVKVAALMLVSTA